MSNELVLNRGVGEKLMSIGIGKSSPKTVSAQDHEGAPIKEREPRAIDFWIWDCDGSTVDTMSGFRSTCVDVAMKYFGEYGLNIQEAGIWYDADTSAAGTRYMEEIGNFHDAKKEDIDRAISEIRPALSGLIAPPIPYIPDLMVKFNHRKINQSVSSGAFKKDLIKKYRYSGLLQHLDDETIVGEDSGEPGEVLQKGEPQLRKIASVYVARGDAVSYEDFISRAGCFADMKRDMELYISCNLRFVVAFADVATSFSEMVNVGGTLPGDRFRVVTARTIRDVVSYVDMINRIKETE